MGMPGARSSGAFGRPAAAWISVRVVPGDTVFTRTPTGPNSFEVPVVSALSAALLIA
jgi:hypothetical protein